MRARVPYQNKLGSATVQPAPEGQPKHVVITIPGLAAGDDVRIGVETLYQGAMCKGVLGYWDGTVLLAKAAPYEIWREAR